MNLSARQVRDIRPNLLLGWGDSAMTIRILHVVRRTISALTGLSSGRCRLN
jgi:hypothetical protein